MKRAHKLMAIFASLTARVRASVWTLPIAKVLLAMGGLALFALIGRTTLAEAKVEETTPITITADTPTATPQSTPPSTATPPSTPTSTSTSTSTSAAVPITAEAPLVLNMATEEDLQRLPGIGPKKAVAILALRSKLGRFHQVDDLLRVKGIGRATLKRLRPLLRVDPPPVTDAGPAPS